MQHVRRQPLADGRLHRAPGEGTGRRAVLPLPQELPARVRAHAARDRRAGPARGAPGVRCAQGRSSWAASGNCCRSMASTWPCTARCTSRTCWMPRATGSPPCEESSATVASSPPATTCTATSAGAWSTTSTCCPRFARRHTSIARRRPSVRAACSSIASTGGFARRWCGRRSRCSCPASGAARCTTRPSACGGSCRR